MFCNRFGELLIEWYLINKRELPWRDTTDPYLIWISEIILQQTRVKQGLDYYKKFVSRFPDASSLAGAELEEVLKYWQGLGYYSRARNLHAAARQIMDIYEGVFPSEHKDILSLKGVGEYTAAAIASFAFRQPHAVVDGNVYRVLSRYMGVDVPIDSPAGKKLFASLAAGLLDTKNPDTYNQAIMEMGALQCVPQSPDCTVCPLKEGCVANAEGRVQELPVKEGKTKVRDRWFNYLVLRYQDKTWLHQRTGKDIWSHLYEFPLIETERSMGWEELINTPRFKAWFDSRRQLCVRPLLVDKKHILSHQRIHASFYLVELQEPFHPGADSGYGDVGVPDAFIACDWDDIDRYPVSRLTHLCIEQLG